MILLLKRLKIKYILLKELKSILSISLLLHIFIYRVTYSVLKDTLYTI